MLSGSIVPYFGHLRLDEVNQSHVNRFVAEQKTSTKTINNKLTVLSTMLRYAASIGLIEEPKLKCHVKSMSPDIVAVPADEVAKLIVKATDDRFRLAVLLASEGGLRVSEIRGLQHTDVRGGQLTVRRAIDQAGNVGSPKHDKRRSVPLSPTLATALANVPKRGLWVVAQDDGEPMRYEQLRDGLNALYELAGIDVPVSESGVTMPWHSLRHSFGTELAARGVPIPVIKELMGHASIATTMRYVTVTGSQLNAGIALAFGTERQQAGNSGNAEAEKAKPPGSSS